MTNKLKPSNAFKEEMPRETTSEQILKKAIEKAVENGWKLKDNVGDYRNLKDFDILIDYSCPVKFICFENKTTRIDRYLERIIFSHDFAKAFWDKEHWLLTTDGGKTWKKYYYKPPALKCIGRSIKHIGGWKYQLQQLVLEKEPIKYLEKFL